MRAENRRLGSECASNSAEEIEMDSDEDGQVLENGQEAKTSNWQGVLSLLLSAA
jgi:hypothetical protein